MPSTSTTSKASPHTPAGKPTPGNAPKTSQQTPVVCGPGWTKTLLLPWPPKALSPNARGHWATLAKAKKEFRTRCAWLAKAQGLPSFKNAPQADLRAFLAYTFCPPDRRARDLDNVLAAMKSGNDGLVDAMGIDDSRWGLSVQWGEVVTGGEVRVTVEVC